MGIKIDKSNIEDAYSMSDIQKGMVYHSLKDADTHVYHNQTVYQWKDNQFDSETFEKALMLMVEKHPILRTGFQVFDFDEPIQVVYKRTSFNIQHNNISHLDKPEQSEYINKSLEDDRQRAFNLSAAGPLWRIKTFTLGNGDNCLVWICHHAIMDGWSSASLATELYNTYSTLKSDPNFVPVKLKSTYKDFVIQQDVEKRKTENIEYWRKELHDYKRLNFPGLSTESGGINRSRGEGKRKNYSKKLSGQLFDELNNTVKKFNTSTKNMCFGAYIYMLSILTYENDLVVGLITHNRPVCKDGDKILGCFLNTVPFRMKIPMNITWSEYMKRIDNKLRELSKYNKFSLLEIIRIIGDESKDKNPILDTIFTYTDFHVFNQLEEGDFNNKSNTLSLESQARTNTLFDFFVNITSGEFKIAASYTDYIISDKLVADLFVCFENVLNNFISRPGIQIDNKDVMPIEEKQKLLNYFNDTKADYPREMTIHELFERQVEKIPGDQAVLFGKTALTYRELNEESNQLARILRKQGIGAEGITAMLMERAIEMIIGILAILKAGGAYLPIDTEYPHHRIQFMLEDSGAKTLLTSQKIKLPPYYEGNKIIIDDGEIQKEKRREEVSNPANINSPTDLAYIIYTSGTTGHPKGVMIEHKNVVRLLVNDKNVFHFSRSDVWTLFHSYCFDFSVWEMYGALLYGGQLVIIPSMTARDPKGYLEILRQNRVTILNQTPSAFYNLIDEEIKRRDRDLKIRYVIFGGEALKPAKLKPWKLKYPGTKLVNMFGITETTVHVTYKEITEKEIQFDISNIGKPIPTTTCYVLDSQQELLPVGVAGELCVGGDGVGRGYLKREELTREKFIKNPFRTGERLYRSGDLVRILENGEMEYLGRLDHQIQLRGFRIELGEIESKLIKHNEINEALILAKEDENGDKYLCAYYASHHQLNTAELREYLSKELPAYMIPSYFVHLTKMPLTPNGKIDRKALPDIGGVSVEEFIEPRNDLERKLAEIWENFFGIKKISINTSFFELGGDSIKAIRLITQLNRQLNSDIAIADLYLNETIEKLTEKIRHSENEKLIEAREKVLDHIKSLKEKILSVHPDPDDVEDVYPMTDIEQGMVYDYLRANVYHGQFVYSRNYRNFDPERFKKAVNLMIEKHEILRTSFNLEDFGEPVQVVHQAIEWELSYTDISHLSRIEKDEYIKNEIRQDFQRPFDEKVPPLWRMQLFRLDEYNISLLFVCHHAIFDGWSKASLMVEIHNTYLELETNPGFIPKRLKCTNKDAVIAEIMEKQKESNINFWRNELMGYQSLDFLPPARMNSDMENFGEQCLGAELLEKLEKISQKYNTLVRHLSFAAYVYVLNMMFYADEIVAGFVTNIRPVMEDGDKVLGCYLNTIPLRIKIPRGIKWSDYISLVENKLQEVKKYERVSLFEIARLMEENKKEKNPFFDTIFNFVNFHVYDQARPQEDVLSSSIDDQPYSFYREGDRRTNTLFDIEVSATYGRLAYHVKYNIAAIKREFAERFCIYFERVLDKFVREPSAFAAKDSIIPNDEKQRILIEFNKTKAQYSSDMTLFEIFENQVEKNPGHTAVIFDGVEITYSDLNREANRLASALRPLGVKGGVLVGIIIERSIEMIVGVMGILKAGGAYVPLEPYLPGNRIKKLLSNLNLGCLVTGGSQFEKIIKITGEISSIHTIFCLNEVKDSEICKHVLDREKRLFDVKDIEKLPGDNPKPISGSDDLAYIIFTSGSTGVPKGVVVKHQPVINVIEWVNKTFNISDSDKLLFITSLSFDLSVYDIFGILASGAAIRLVSNDDIKDPRCVLDIIMNEGITFWDSAPAALQQLVPLFNEVKGYNETSQLRLVFLSGDWIPVPLPDIFRETFEGVNVISLGGATEATIWSNFYPIGPVDPMWNSIPYGKPIRNAKYYILDQYLEICPIGVSGDLYIGGECLALAYVNDVELTTNKFLDNPYCYGEKIYKTGDVARWFEDGNMEFLGRKDHQVKIRGFRVELGEIESHLLKHDEIKEDIVIIRDNKGDKYICAYYVSDRELDKEALRRFLLNELPEYMIPSYFVHLETLPVTPNGKVDRKALPEPDVMVEGAYTAPTTGIERELVKIWSEVLNLPEETIGINANFFELGGHSLNATMVVSKIHKVLKIKVSLKEIFRWQTLRELSEYIRGIRKDKFESIEPSENKEYYRLSSAQRSLYLIQQINPDSVGYNEPETFEIAGNLKFEGIEKAFEKIISRHEILRTAIEIVDGEPAQRLLNRVDYRVIYRKASEEESEYIFKTFVRPFNLSKPPFLRIGLIRIEPEKHILMLDMHHIIADHISYPIILGELLRFYQGQELPGLRLQYKDYAEWQHKEEVFNEIKMQKHFWLKEFEGEIPVLNIPADYPRPPIKSFEGGSTSFVVNREELSNLRRIASDESATLFMVLLAISYILLYKLSNQEDIVIGTPIAGRNHVDLENLVGMFVNALALRNYIPGGRTFKEFLQKVKERTIRALENQYYPFEELVSEIGGFRDMSRNPLFEVMFNLINLGMQAGVSLDNPESQLKISPYITGKITSKFDLTLMVTEDEDELYINVDYCRKIFTRETIERYCQYFKNIVSAVITHDGKKIKDIVIITEEEKKQILVDFNDTQEEYPKGKTIHECFAAQAERTPDRVAVVGSKQLAISKEGTRGLAPLYITYRELNEKSNQLAGFLRGKGVAANTIVGIMVERSIEMIVGILGILKAGGASLPLDPDYPGEWNNFILRDSGIHLLVMQECFKGGFKELVEEIYLEDDRLYRRETVNPENIKKSDDLSHIVYISDAAGRPKGVMLEHLAVVNGLLWMQKRYHLDQKDTFLQKARIASDLCLWELLWPLTQGSKVFLFNKKDQPEPKDIAEAIEKNHITAIHFVPSYFNMFLQYIEGNGYSNKLSGLKWVFTSGETLSMNQVEQFHKLLNTKNNKRLIYLYGPTDAASRSTFFECPNELIFESIPLGRPIGNTNTYILNNYHLQPVYLSGELFISGNTLARGYLNNISLTAENFIDNPYKPGEKMLKTGDWARWLPDGNIEFLGRKDRQLKFNGNSIELDEIETHLKEAGDVEECFVMVKKDQDDGSYLCAYLLPLPGRDIDLKEVREKLLNKIPGYMIPGEMIEVENLSITNNEKISGKDLLEFEKNFKKNELVVKEIHLREDLRASKSISIDGEFEF